MKFSVTKMFLIEPYLTLIIIFVILKLTKQINWDWWAVLLPFWLRIFWVSLWIYALIRRGNNA